MKYTVNIVTNATFVAEIETENTEEISEIMVKALYKFDDARKNNDISAFKYLFEGEEISSIKNENDEILYEV